MPGEIRMGLRDRRRAETVGEIKRTALDQLETAGAPGLTLRAVAREIGVSVQALYHYFDSREALLTALVTDAYTALADAVAEGGRTVAEGDDRLVSASLAYRRWALDNRSSFSLILGPPVSGYAAPPDGPTTQAAARLGVAFRDVVFGDWTPAELDGVDFPADLPELADALRHAPVAGMNLPPGALALFTYGWSTLHGYVTLEAHGHVPWAAGSGESMCRLLARRCRRTIETARRGGSWT